MKPLRSLASLVFLFFALFIPSSGQDASRIILSADLKSDLAVLRRAYEQIHPGLYRYNTKDQMNANFAELDREFSRDLSLREAYLAFSVFLAKIECGHSYANFYNQPKATAAALFKDQNRVPFYFRWLDGKMIVVKSFSDQPQLARGTQILAINGVPTKTILSKLMTIARADGSNDAKRVASLEVLGGDRYETFDIYFPLFFPQTSTKLSLEVKPFDSNKTVKMVVEALTYEQRLNAMPLAAESTKSDDQVFDFSYLDSKTAILRMPTWALFDSKWDWNKFVNESIDELVSKNIPNLIVDIRPNEGGIDAGDAITSRLIEKNLPQSQWKRLVRYRKAPADLIPYLDTWDRSFDDWGAFAVDNRTDGYFTLTKYDDDPSGIVIKPFGTRYTGRVFVLVGATNSSATFEFAQLMKSKKLATLVGQPTGGNQRGINGGGFYFLGLPKSKIEMDLPLQGLFSSSDAPDSGVEPDIYVRPTVSDIANGIDSEIVAVKRLIKKSN